MVDPKVSIIIPVYNGGDYLREAIDSALVQTYPNIEVLVVNDGSNDDGATERVALSYGERIRYYSKPNGGVATALNTAIEHASGEYISWLSHDDLYVPEKVATQMAFLATLAPEARARAIVYSDYAIFTTDAAKSTPVVMRKVTPQEFRCWITTDNSLHGCSLLIPKAAFTKTGLFDAALRTTQDYDLWFRMATQFDFYPLDAHLVKARSHAEQGSVRMSELAKKECNALLSGFVQGLSREELLRDSPTLSIAYAKIAANMWYRGFTQTGWVAARLMLGKFSMAKWQESLQALGICAKGQLMYLVIRPLRKNLPPEQRRRIINFITLLKRDPAQAVIRLLPVSLKRTVRGYTQPGALPKPNAITKKVHTLGLKEKFSKVYAENIFGGSVSRSGEGSDLHQTDVIRKEIPAIIRELHIRSFLDAPCGDWYWMQHVELPVERYIGVDIVEDLIKANEKNFGDERTAFQCLNLAENPLPQVDLIFSRDCLVHLSYADALKIIANFKRSGSTYLLTTSFTERESNINLGNTFWRPLDLQKPPFNFPAPLRLINEGCTEGENMFTDKCLCLWRLEDIAVAS